MARACSLFDTTDFEGRVLAEAHPELGVPAPISSLQAFRKKGLGLLMETSSVVKNSCFFLPRRIGLKFLGFRDRRKVVVRIRIKLSLKIRQRLRIDERTRRVPIA